MNYWIGWQTISKLGIAIAIGFIYLLYRYYRGSFDQQRFGLRSFIWVAPYLGGLVLLSYLGSFGGKNIIPFGWDFLVIGVFSLIILKLALMTRVENVQDQFQLYQNEHAGISII
jgi:multisubunit Na+/H+ antiporter MnhB subunit